MEKRITARARGLYAFWNMLELKTSANDSLITSPFAVKSPQWSVGHYFEEEGRLKKEVMKSFKVMEAPFVG